MKNPKAKLWSSFLFGFLIIVFLLLLSAGTLNYWQAWVYLAVGFVTSIPLALYITKDPVLLEGRSKAGYAPEGRLIQKIIVFALMPAWIAVFIVPGLDHRFDWSNVPLSIIVVGDLLILLSMWMVYRVFKENSFGSATVELQKDQKVISTGPYAIVRNPMYSSASVYFVGISLALSSWWGLIPAALITLGFVIRLFDEEKFLRQNLPGYKEYCNKVRFHLIPWIF
ncbi:MAG: isoprenylcysteine carboxylmethyltransferase family protein [Patescibacteria group bacterium]|nr:isoprenylcysteine carboxylmethyltransferase family protein [Patescibacteria group bacterium]